MARSAYSGSAPWGRGMATRGFMSAGTDHLPFDLIQRARPAVLPDFHNECCNQNDCGGDDCNRKCDMPVCERHVWTHATQAGPHHSTNNSQEQAYSKGQQSE